ncbi:class I SAM-dependent methyltransferase [Neisseria sp.]|uniref:class I SAM-dependent methyltransferase n=1 Tax=Neisseria sp. TaxID=192066 RepID=UPI00359F1D1C
MYLDNILPFAHKLLKARIRQGDTVLDGTAGNGHDTLLLAQCTGAGGTVWAFDIQPAAIAATRARLETAGAAAQVRLVCAGHETLAAHVCEPLAAAVFNFGWLPGGDKTLTTRTDTSLTALDAALRLLAPDGLLLAALYPGHEAGQHEAAAVSAWAASLPQQRFAVLEYRFTNRRNRPPFLLAVERLDGWPNGNDRPNGI